MHGGFERERYGSPENQNKFLPKALSSTNNALRFTYISFGFLRIRCTVLETYAMRYNITGLGRVIFYFSSLINHYMSVHFAKIRFL